MTAPARTSSSKNATVGDTASALPPHTGRRSRPVGSGRVWTIWTRRSTAWAAAVCVIAAGLVMLYTRRYAWTASWSGLADYLRSMIMMLGPLAVAFACWEAGRDRKRRTSELLATTPAAPWRRELLRFSVVLAAAVLGYLVVFAVGAAFVAPVATYVGGRWPGSVVLGALGMAALAAVGWTVGHFVAFRLIAPVMAIATYVAIGSSSSFDGGWVQLLPSGTSVPEWQIAGGPLAGAIAFFILVTASVFAVGALRRRWIAALPAALAVVVAIPLSTGNTLSWWEPDLAAQRLVCSDDGVVCLWASHADLLDTVSERARPLIAKITVPGGPKYRLVEQPFTVAVKDTVDSHPAPGPDAIAFGGSGARNVARRNLTYPGAVADAIHGVVYPQCDDGDTALTDIGTAADAMISLPDSGAGGGTARRYAPAVQRLVDEYRAASPEVRRAWLSAEIQAAKTCDRGALHELAKGIQQ